MSVSYFVRYDIAVPDLPAFLERYRKLHVPMVATWPRLQRMVLSLTCQVTPGQTI